MALWVYVQDSACILRTICCACENLDRATATTASTAHLGHGKGYAWRDIACIDGGCGENRVRSVAQRRP